MSKTERKTYPKLTENIETDVTIIGGGITGILCAYRLAKQGKKVVLLEKGKIASSVTPLTTAFITKIIDTNLEEMVSIFGEDTAKSVWSSGQNAVEEFEKIINQEKIGCHFVRCPNYIFANTLKQFENLQEEYETYRKLGIEAEIHEKTNEFNFPNFGFIKIPGQAKFYIHEFIYRLAEIVSNMGVKIFENTEVTGLSENNPIMISTKDAIIKSIDVIIATYKPLINKKMHLKKGMYRSYIFEVEIPKGIFEEAIYEDINNPYHYFRIDPGKDKDSMIIGGEDHKDIFGKTLYEKSYEGLEKFLKEIMAGKDYKIKSKWNGPILEPSDGLPLIGRIQPGYYVATAFSGNGMTYSMISSILITDLILQKENPWQKVYDPTRTLLHPKRLSIKAKGYVEEFIGGALKNMLR